MHNKNEMEAETLQLNNSFNIVEDYVKTIKSLNEQELKLLSNIVNTNKEGVVYIPTIGLKNELILIDKLCELGLIQKQQLSKLELMFGVVFREQVCLAYFLAINKNIRW